MSMLQKQLAAHREKNPLPAPADAKKSRPTILFKGTVNKYDARQIFELGLSGFQQLIPLNGDLKKYQKLFTPTLGSHPNSERHMLPLDEKKMVDELCKGLLLDLSKFLQLDAGKQVLEFLVQRYLVHVANVDALFAAIIPHHETQLFVNVLTIPPRIENTKWSYFAGINTNSSGIPRSALVEASLKNLTLMDEICKVSSEYSIAFFAAFCSECLEASKAHSLLQDCVEVILRNIISPLKSENPLKQSASCRLIASISLLVSLQIDVCESLLFMLARRASKIPKDSELLDEFSCCIIQLFEWQTQDRDPKEFFGSSWPKMKKYLTGMLPSLVRQEQNHCSRLVSEYVYRTIPLVDDETAAWRLSTVVNWDGDCFAERALKVFDLILHSISSQQDNEHIYPIIRRIAEAQPNAFQNSFSKLSPDSPFLLKCFPDPSSRLAIQLIPFQNSANLSIAIRDANITTRLAVLKYLKANPEKALLTLFDPSEGKDCIGLVILNNFVVGPSNDKASLEEVKLLVQLFTNIPSESIFDDCYTELKSLVRKALLLEPRIRDESLFQVLLDALNPGGDEDDLFTLATLVISSKESNLKASLGRRLQKTWLEGLDTKAFKKIAGRLQKLGAIETHISKLEQTSDAVIAISILEEINTPEAATLILSVMNRSNVPTSRPAQVAKLLLEETTAEELINRLLGSSPASWPQTLHILVEILKTSNSPKIRSILEESSQPQNEADPQDELRVLRALRLLHAQLKSSSKKKNQSWSFLLPSLRHSRSREIRNEALNVLSVIPCRFSQILIERRSEILKDVSAIERAVSRDELVQVALRDLAIQSAKQSNFNISRLAVECLRNDQVTASQLLISCKGAVGEEVLVKSCLKSLAGPFNIGYEALNRVCLNGLEFHPRLILGWMISNPPPPSNELFDALLAYSQRELNGDEDSDVLEYIERCGVLLTQIPFSDSHLLSCLKKARKSQSQGSTRSLAILVDVITAHPITNWETMNELFSLLPYSRETGGNLEQIILNGIEKNVARFVEGASSDHHEKLCLKLIDVVNSASSPQSSWIALRAFQKSSPSLKCFEIAFRKIEDPKTLGSLVEAICGKSRAKEEKIPPDSPLVLSFANAVQRLQPSNRIFLLKQFAHQTADPSSLVSTWLDVSKSFQDCSSIVSQYDSNIQTDLIIALASSSSGNSLTIMSFISKHLESRGYMKALVDQSTQTSQFIELLEVLLQNLNENDESNDFNTAAENAIDNLTALLSVSIFIPVLSEILLKAEQKAKIRMLALKVLKSKISDEHRDWTKEETKVVLEFTDQLIQLISDATVHVHHSIVLALNSLAKCLAESHKASFARALIPLSALLNGTGKESAIIQSCACICLGTIGKHVSTHSIPALNVVLPKLIVCAHNKDAFISQAAVSALKDFIESKLPLGSGLDSIALEVALEVSNEDSEETHLLKLDLLSAIGDCSEVRVGFELCQKAFESRKNFQGSLMLLDRFVSRTSTSEAVIEYVQLKQLCQSMVKFCPSTTAFDPACFVKIGLLLSEKKMKEIFDELIIMVTEQDAGDKNSILSVIQGLAEACGSLILPVIPLPFVLDSFRTSLQQNMAGKNGKKKKLKEANDISLEICLGCIGECLSHAIGTGYVDTEQFEILLDLFITSLQIVSSVEFSTAFIEPALASLALCMLSTSRSNASLQSLHHAVTKLLRSDNSTTRQSALSCVKTLFERVGSDYLPLLPDTLPYLAELLEDNDEQVRILAQKVALILKELSGEEISEFLK